MKTTLKQNKHDRFEALLGRIDAVHSQEDRVADAQYREYCAEIVKATYQGGLSHYPQLGVDERKACKLRFDRLRDAARDPLLVSYAAMGQAYMAFVDSLDWKDAEAGRHLLQSEKAFDAILQGVVKATKAGPLETGPDFAKLRRRILDLHHKARSEGAVRASMNIPAPYAGTNLFPAPGKTVSLNPLKPVRINKAVCKELEGFYTILYSETPLEAVKEEIKKYDRAYMGVLLDICHKDKIYPELKTPEDIIALPPLRRIGVLKVMEDYYAPGSKSLALRNRARAQHFMLSYRGMNQIRAAGITTSFAQRLHRDAGGNAEDAPPAAEAIFTLVYPHNPVVTNASKAEYAYGLAPGEGAGYHLGRREDMQRALLHEMGHALSNDRICKLGKFKRLSFASASHSEMVSDVFASLVLQDNSLRTELRAINAMLHNGPYFHYTNPALLLITPTDMTSAIGKNMMEIFDMAWDIAERGHAGYKTGEIVDLQREFDTQFSRQITQYEERKIKPSQVTTAMKSTAECDVLLKSIDACKQLPWLTDFQQRLLDEAADDVRFIHEMRMAKPKENYITDVVNSARFGGNVPALVEVLSREHTYMQDVMSHSYYQLMEQLEASRRPISEGLIKKIRRVGNEMDDIRHMAEAVHMGILKQQAIAGRVSDAESAISKK